MRVPPSARTAILAFALFGFGPMAAGGTALPQAALPRCRPFLNRGPGVDVTAPCHTIIRCDRLYSPHRLSTHSFVCLSLFLQVAFLKFFFAHAENGEKTVLSKRNAGDRAEGGGGEEGGEII